MNKQAAQLVKVGDFVKPIPLWNKTNRYRKLECPTEILEIVDTMLCQSGIMFKVKIIGGGYMILDASWFE
jgi:hypothetical protein